MISGVLAYNEPAIKAPTTDLTYSFIIPAYNESERLSSSLPKVLDYIRQQRLQAEVIVVNDGSNDDTADVVRQFAATNPEVRLLENPGNRGKGYSVRNGMLHANGDVMLFTDADLSSPIYEADKLFAAIAAGRRHRHRLALVAGGAANRTAAVVSAALRTAVQPRPANRAGAEISRHPMRL